MNRGDSERMAIIETDIKYIKDQINQQTATLKIFIEKAEKTYATKEELKAVDARIIDHSKATTAWLRWLPSLLSSLVAFVAFIIAITK